MHTYSTRRENTLKHVDRRKNQRHPPPPYFPLLQDFLFLLENKRKPKKEWWKKEIPTCGFFSTSTCQPFPLYVCIPALEIKMMKETSLACRKQNQKRNNNIHKWIRFSNEKSFYSFIFIFSRFICVVATIQYINRLQHTLFCCRVHYFHRHYYDGESYHYHLSLCYKFSVIRNNVCGHVVLYTKRLQSLYFMSNVSLCINLTDCDLFLYRS